MKGVHSKKVLVRLKVDSTISMMVPKEWTLHGIEDLLRTQAKLTIELPEEYNVVFEGAETDQVIIKAKRAKITPL